MDNWVPCRFGAIDAIKKDDEGSQGSSWCCFDECAAQFGAGAGKIDQEVLHWETDNNRPV